MAQVFNGYKVSHGVNLADPPSGVLDVTDTDNLSISLWYRRSGAGSFTRQVLASKRNIWSSRSGPGYTLDLRGTGALQLTLHDGTNAFKVTTTAKTYGNNYAWHHVVAVFDRDSAAGDAIYVDGAEAAVIMTGTIGNIGTLENNTNFRLAHGSNNDFWFNGRID